MPQLTTLIPSFAAPVTDRVWLVGAHGGAGCTTIRHSDPERFADAGRTDPWTDQVDASRGEYVGDGVPRTFNGEPFEPLSGYPTPGAAPAPADPAAPDFLSTPSDFTTGNAR